MAASVKRVIRVLGTSTRPIEVELDDGRRAFVKVQGNPEGPTALACEFIGTSAASALGVPTFEIDIATFPRELCLPLDHGLIPEPGPCFAAIAVDGISWDGGEELLDALENPEHVGSLVVLDTWIRNPDRYTPRIGAKARQNLRNVFLAETSASRGSYRLLAIDHTHCIRGDRELVAQLRHFCRARRSAVRFVPCVCRLDRSHGSGGLRRPARRSFGDVRNRRPRRAHAARVASRYANQARSGSFPEAPCCIRRGERGILARRSVRLGFAREDDMKNAGFYSIVQFCPDAERREVVNVGVVVGAPGLGLRVRMAERNEHVKNVFGAGAFDDTRVSFAKTGLERRIADIEPTREALTAFVSQESGQLVLSPPQPMMITDLLGDCLGLFLRLVSDPEVRRREGRARKPDLRPLVRGLRTKNVPIEWRPAVTIPIIDEPLKADFSFQNGARNLVKAIGIAAREDAALNEVAQLASRGLLLARHAERPSKLVVIAEVDDAALQSRVDSLLSDHEVRFVDAADLSEFAREIERDAH